MFSQTRQLIKMNDVFSLKLRDDCNSIPIFLTREAIEEGKDPKELYSIYSNYEERLEAYDDCVVEFSFEKHLIQNDIAFLVLLLLLTSSAMVFALVRMLRVVKKRESLKKASSLTGHEAVSKEMMRLISFHSWLIVFWSCFLVILCLFPVLLTLMNSLRQLSEEDQSMDAGISFDLETKQLVQLYKSVTILFIGLVGLFVLDFLRCLNLCFLSTGNDEELHHYREVRVPLLETIPEETETDLESP